MPRILEHSKTQIEVVHGQEVVLTAKAEQSVKIEWYTRDSKICDGESCTFKSGYRAPGIHNLGAVAVNRFGSSFVSFRILVRKDSKDAQVPAPLVVPTVAASLQDELPLPEDFQVRALRGQGFSYRIEPDDSGKMKFQVVKRLARKLDWNEKLKSSVAQFDFGRGTTEKHTLYSSGIVQLEKLGQNRAIVLNEGALRSRLDGPLHLSYEIPGWLTIRPEGGADFLFFHSTARGSPALLLLNGVLYKTGETIEEAISGQKFIEFQRPEESEFGPPLTKVTEIGKENLTAIQALLKEAGKNNTGAMELENQIRSLFEAKAVNTQPVIIVQHPTQVQESSKEKPWILQGSLSVLHDSSILRKTGQGEAGDLETDILNKGAGYRFWFNSGIRTDKTRFWRITLDLDISRRSWLDQELQDVNWVDQKAAVGISLGRTLPLKVSLGLRTLIWHRHRALDGLSVQLEWEAMDFYFPVRFMTTLSRFVDPIPDDVEPADALSFEHLEIVSDRSSRLFEIGLTSRIFQWENGNIWLVLASDSRTFDDAYATEFGYKTHSIKVSTQFDAFQFVQSYRQLHLENGEVWNDFLVTALVNYNFTPALTAFFQIDHQIFSLEKQSDQEKKSVMQLGFSTTIH